MVGIAWGLGLHDLERCKALQAKHILVAVGGRAVQIPIEGAEHSIISDDILELEKVCLIT